MTMTSSTATVAPDHDHDLACDAWIRRGIARFERWFCHVDFGRGIVARSTSWPDAPLNSPHMGVSKFQFIVQRNLPDLTGMRVLELGCNAGAVSVRMAQLGAREVVGIDSHVHWPGWQEQAEFVKEAFERRSGEQYNVRFIDGDIAALPEMNLGRFDAVIALNCLYYLKVDEIDQVARHVAEHCPRMLVQCNVKDHASYLGDRAHPSFMRGALERAGYRQVQVDWPWDRRRWGVVPKRYHRPVVVAWH